MMSGDQVLVKYVVVYLCIYIYTRARDCGSE